MSVGTDLQDMENIEENVVTKGAKPAMPQEKVSGITPGNSGSVEDLGGPTPENYKPDDDSAKLKHLVKPLSKLRMLLAKVLSLLKNLEMLSQVQNFRTLEIR